jgi:LPS O-antigen subunit length determinant protein (WzzB/FepE family)
LRIDGQIMSTAPNGELVLRVILSQVWKFKWLIAAATIAAALATFVLSRSDAPQVWTGKTILTIGIAPAKSYFIQEDGTGLVPIKTQREVIAEISDPLFKEKIIAQTAFRPATAAFSREMTASSLRAVAVNNDRDVAVEVSAASDEDVQAVLRGLAAEIEKEHKEIIKQRLESVSAEVEDLQGRIAVIEKSIEAISRAPDSVADDKSRSRPLMVMPDMRTWSDLKDRVRRGSNLIKFSETTVFRAEPDSYPRAARSIGALRASILAGLVMLAAMVVLTIVLSSRPRASD